MSGADFPYTARPRWQHRAAALGRADGADRRATLWRALARTLGTASARQRSPFSQASASLRSCKAAPLPG